VQEEEHLIRKTAQGDFVFMKQNFDWLEKPVSAIDAESTRVNSVKVHINKVFDKSKKPKVRNSGH
jgi:hypothetical protein